MDLWTSDLNYLAVVITALATMVVGALWYARFLFGGIWMDLIGKTQEELEAQGNQVQAFASVTVAALVTSYVLALFVHFTGAQSFVDSLVMGLWLCVGIVIATSLGHYVFSGFSFRLWSLDNGRHLVTIPIISGILAVWQ